MANNKDNFGDRMKMYEQIEAGRMCLPLLPVLARLDGKCFHNFTKYLERPFDKRFSDLMIDTTKQLVDESNARLGYSQSDEINLVFYSDNIKSEIFFNGKIQKMVSVLSSMATAYFNKKMLDYLPDNAKHIALFDCRIWTVPNLVEAANAILWREMDATKNSISMAAQSVYSSKQLHGKSGSEQQEMLFVKGINWNDYPSFFKRGTFIQRKTRNMKFTPEEIDKLPLKHEARTNPELEVERSIVEIIDMPPFNQVINRVEVIFDGEFPIIKELIGTFNREL